VIDRVAYGTITIMCVLIVYDGWSELKLVEVLGVIVGPIIAMFCSHIFSSSLAQQVTLKRRLNRVEMIETIRAESLFLLLAVPPSALAVVLTVGGASLTNTIRVIIWFGVATLGFWGGLAARRAGLGGRSLVMAVMAGLIVGLLVLAIQVLLQPGRVLSGGTL
jgi:hypothetical protein